MNVSLFSFGLYTNHRLDKTPVDVEIRWRFVRAAVYIYTANAMYIVGVFVLATWEEHLVLESVVDAFLGADDGRRLRDVLAEDLGFDEPGQPDGELVADKLLGGDLEDLCEGCQRAVVGILRGA